MKGHYNWYLRSTKDKRLLWKIIVKLITEPRRNRYTFRNRQPTKTQLWRNTKSEQTNNDQGDWGSNQKPSQKKNPGTLVNFVFDFYETKVREKLMPILFKLCQKIEGDSQTHFMMSAITLISKPDKDATRNEN